MSPATDRRPVWLMLVMYKKSAGEGGASGPRGWNRSLPESEWPGPRARLVRRLRLLAAAKGGEARGSRAQA